jgi:hypothetical protein
LLTAVFERQHGPRLREHSQVRGPLRQRPGGHPRPAVFRAREVERQARIYRAGVHPHGDGACGPSRPSGTRGGTAAQIGS